MNFNMRHCYYKTTERPDAFHHFLCLRVEEEAGLQYDF